MSKAVRCPVCEGRGTIAHRGIDPGSTSKEERTCHGCAGKGWVEISTGMIELSSFEEPKSIEINIKLEAGKFSVESIRKFANLLLENFPKKPEW